MSKLSWDDSGSRFYTTGVDRGVFYPPNSKGVVWNGLISVRETPSETEIQTKYLDGIRYQTGQPVGDFSAAVVAFTYPSELSDYVGQKGIVSHQIPKTFGFSYRVFIGNDLEGNSHGYQIHLVYNSLANERNSPYTTFDNSIDLTNFEFSIATKAVPIPGGSPSAHVVIDTRVARPEAVDDLEDLLYGTDFTEPRFPSFPEILEIFESHAILRIIDHGDGTWTAIGPDEAIVMLDPTTFRITWPSAVYIDDVTYTISSL